MKNSEKGFTLIELIVVVAIIAILTAIAIPSYSKIRAVSYKSAVKSDVKTVTSNIMFFILEKNTVPSISPNPCSGVCTISDGAETITVKLSKSVYVDFSTITCPSGENGFKITGSHIRLPSWQYEYNSCLNSFKDV